MNTVEFQIETNEHTKQTHHPNKILIQTYNATATGGCAQAVSHLVATSENLNETTKATALWLDFV